MRQYWATQTEAAELYGVDPRTIRNWDQRYPGQISKVKLGRYRMYNLSDLADLVRRYNLVLVA